MPPGCLALFSVCCGANHVFLLRTTNKVDVLTLVCDAQQVGAQFDMETTAMTFSTVGACTPLIGCEPAWNETQARAVVAIYVVHPDTATVVICSGGVWKLNDVKPWGGIST